jgi:hypothetical protein
MESQLERQSKAYNPWFSIWIKPRDTMKEVFNTNPKNVFLLILLGSFVHTLNLGVSAFGSTDRPQILVIPIILFTFFSALIYYFLVPTILRWVGSKLGGQGTVERIRYAVAYYFVPYVYSIVLVWLPTLFLFGMENFTSETPRIDSSQTLTVLFFSFQILDFIIVYWAIFIFLKCVGEAHQFSVWKSLLTSILSFLIFFLALYLIVMLIVTIMIMSLKIDFF